VEEALIEKNHGSKLDFKLLVVGIFTIIIVGLGTFIGLYWYKFSRLPWEPKESVDTGKAVSDISEMDATLISIPGASEVEKVARVGDEYLFITDLEYYANLRLMTLEEIDRSNVIEELIDESIMLQSGEQEGWIELDLEVFNNPFKNFDKRRSLMVEVEDKFNYYKRDQLIIEQVAVFVWNVEMGELARTEGMDVARSFAKEKIDNVYRLVTEEGKTMKEAGEILANDTSLLQLDENYKGNAYGEILLSEERDLVPEESDLGSFLSTAKEGDISSVYLERIKTDTGEEIDVRYVFYKLKSKQTGFEDVSDWIKDCSKSVPIDIYTS